MTARQRTTRSGRSRAARTGWLRLLVAGALLAAACGGDGDSGSGGNGGAAGEDLDALGENIVLGPQEDDAEPTRGGSITVGLESETNSFLPSVFQGSQAGINVAYAVYDPLMIRTESGELEPYLAESMEPNEDFTQWTLTLRPDIVFHDGTPLDAEALKTIFDDYLKAPGANTAGALRDASMEVVDELTVRYVLVEPNAQFPDILTIAPGWPFSPTAAAAAGEDFGSAPVGTGPFRFVSWQRDGAFVVERNPDYWQEGLPHLDEVTFRPIPDEETRATSLSSGDVDAVQSVRLSSFLTQVKDIPDVEVALGLGNGGGVVLFNAAEPPVDDVRVRQALAHALEQQALVDVVAGEAAAATELRSQFFWSDSPYYSEAVAEAWPQHDPERAQELYDEYVNDPNRSDGKEVGEPISLTYDCTNVPSLIEQATAVQGFWEELGAQVEVNPLDQTTLINSVITDDFQVGCYRAGLDFDPYSTFDYYFDDPAEVVTNFANYTHETLDQAMDDMRTTDDQEALRSATEQAGLQLAEDVPYYWTGSDLTFIAYDQRVHGVNSWRTPAGTLGDGAAPGITFWSQVWVEEQE